MDRSRTIAGPLVFTIVAVLATGALDSVRASPWTRAWDPARTWDPASAGFVPGDQARTWDPASAGFSPQPPAVPPSFDGRIQWFYFDALGYTEAWIDLAPAADGGGPGALTLNFTIRYRGKKVEGPLAHAPEAVLVRAQASPQANPLMMRQPILVVLADDAPLLDPGQRVDFYRSGGCEAPGSCPSDTVQVPVPPETLWRIAGARVVRGNALGFTFVLSDAQIDAVRRLAESVLPRPPL
jgi:hypothetical protein